MEYAACCEPLHNGEAPTTAEALMRSRYAAYVVGDIDYLFRTTHPSVRKPTLRAGYQSTHDSIQWLGLEVLEVFQGGTSDKTGKVVFRATYRQNGRVAVHWERSCFKRHHGQWHYLDGIVEDAAVE